MIEAPVIHIDRTDRGQIIIRQDTFGMDKSRCVLIDLHAGTHLSDKISFAREDCTSLSFADDTFDAVTVAFGIRNFEGLDKGLAEMCRVLKTGGHLVILELSTPDRFPMKQLFTIYSKVVIPLLGKCLSKDNSAYTYLPQSIRAFPQKSWDAPDPLSTHPSSSGSTSRMPLSE